MKRNFHKYGCTILCGMLLFAFTAPVFPAAEDDAEAKLEKAREDLRISRATQNRIASEIERLRFAGDASPARLKDYETYLKNVELMVLENQRIVRNMEAAYARRKGTGHISNTDGFISPIDTAIPEDMALDKLTVLDRELNDSLAAFDEMLLRELALIRAGSAAKMKDFAVEAADAARRVKDKGGSGTFEEGGDDEKGSNRDLKDAATTTGQEKDISTEAANPGQDRSRPGKKGGTTREDKRKAPSGEQDDDIVARQLREAAENETDPKLRAKLWEKYREYKKSTAN